MIAVIDYGMGNLHSMAKALERVCDQPVEITSDPERVRLAERVVFPGVGAMGACMAELKRLELDAVLREVASDRPLLGVCLGMQALFERSEEDGGVTGLGLLPGRVQRFDFPDQPQLKIPHMGWNRVQFTDQNHPLWQGLASEWFYFVHSYYCEPDEAGDVAARSEYGQSFCPAVLRGSIAAVQFHPEKSQAAGLRLLSNFLAWEPARAERDRRVSALR